MKLALIGDPVAHSRSPQIVSGLLRAAGIESSYDLVRVPGGETAAALRRLREAGYDGCNVTSPLKEEANAACDRVSAASRHAGAVNTVAFRNRTVGTTTDGIGAAAALREQLGALRGKEILVLGTGPTARAALAQLAEEGARLWLWSRGDAKVSALCNAIGALAFLAGATVHDAVFSALPPNADVPEAVCDAARRASVAMDANYGERSTLEARLGRAVVDGSRMLEEQARASVAFWTDADLLG